MLTFDKSNIINRGTFEYWFTRIGVSDSWNVYKGECFIGTFNESDMSYDRVNINSSDVDEYTDILRDFTSFKMGRPEYLVGKCIESKYFDNSVSCDEQFKEIGDLYNTFIYGVSCLLNDSDEQAVKYADRCITWLQNTDFYIAPASTIYHDAEPCGLLRHSVKTVNKMTELLSIPSFNQINVAEAILTALVHDWCKIDFYEKYMRNVKDENTGVWNKVPAYKCKGSSIPFGHGVTSMFMVQKFFRLTTEQALAIRWHMGRWNTCDKELVDLCNANEKYPLVHLLQFADQLSMTAYC